jgi:hypothetical protein
MLPPVVAPKIEQSHMNVPIHNNVVIPGTTHRAGAYLVQAVVAPKVENINR